MLKGMSCSLFDKSLFYFTSTLEDKTKMVFNFRNFTRSVTHSLKQFGSRVNRGFNVIKHHSKRAIPYIKSVSGLIKDAAAEWSSLPVVGAAASQIGAFARGVHKAAGVAERVFDASDRWQGAVGIDRGLR
jgi:hypothetical protein